MEESRQQSICSCDVLGLEDVFAVIFAAEVQLTESCPNPNPSPHLTLTLPF